MKRLAVVASGWHFPYSFYESIKNQNLPVDWQVDMFCVSHRNPTFSAEEKSNIILEGERAYLDLKLYSKIAFIDDIESLNWKYIEYPNTIGDWGCSNQWLDDNDYNTYDLILFTHDDNLIISDNWFKDIICDTKFSEWEILSNSCGAPAGWLRGSCEFFKPSILNKIGGKFDLSLVYLNRTNKFYGSQDIDELSDWNNTVVPLMNFIKSNDIKVKYLSNFYRVSQYCLEGERGFISKTTFTNTQNENEGLKFFNLI
jgi:hypothetical protein